MRVENIISAGGMFLLLLVAFAISANRRSIKWRTVVWGLVLQLVFALLILKTGPGEWFFSSINVLVIKLLSFERVGAEFVFGVLAVPAPETQSLGFIFAFQVLPTIIFFASLMAVLYHLKIVQRVVGILSRVMRQFLGTSGAETFAVSANVFLGYIESPLLVRPYLKGMTRSELVTVMTAGMATVAGGVMVAFVGMLRSHFPDIAGHLLAASVMSVPAAIAVAKILVPETEEPVTIGAIETHDDGEYHNIIDAAAGGATGAVKLVFSIIATLIAFMALLSLLNALVGWLCSLGGLEGVTLQWLLSFLFAPVGWVMGIPWQDCMIAGQLFGEKIVLNEFVAFLELKEMLDADPAALSPRSITIITYGLCGFANFLSLGAMIGGMSALVPERRRDIARDGLLALVGGVLACFLTGAIAGILLS